MIRALAVSVATAVTLLPTVPAAAAPPCTQATKPVLVRTLPAMPTAVVHHGSRRLTSDGSGNFTGLTGCPEQLRRSLTITKDIQLGNGVRARFSRWVEGSRTITAWYDLHRLVTFRFRTTAGLPVPVRELDEFAVKSSTGEVIRATSSTLWLRSERIQSSPEGPRVKDIKYVIESVLVDTAEVVRRGQQRFVPAERTTMDVSLLFFPITLRTRDALFGSAVGREVVVTHPNGRVSRHTLDGGTLTLPPLPRGNYKLQVIAPGPRVVHPLALSKPQEVELDVLTWLDIGSVAGGISLIALLLLVARRPHLRPHPALARPMPRRRPAITIPPVAIPMPSGLTGAKAATPAPAPVPRAPAPIPAPAAVALPTLPAIRPVGLGWPDRLPHRSRAEHLLTGLGWPRGVEA